MPRPYNNHLNGFVVLYNRIIHALVVPNFPFISKRFLKPIQEQRFPLFLAITGNNSKSRRHSAERDLEIVNRIAGLFRTITSRNQREGLRTARIPVTHRPYCSRRARLPISRGCPNNKSGIGKRLSLRNDGGIRCVAFSAAAQARKKVKAAGRRLPGPHAAPGIFMPP